MLAYTANSTGAFPGTQEGKKATLLSESKSSHPSRITDAKQNSREMKRHQRAPGEQLWVHFLTDLRRKHIMRTVKK